jgi:hypothetical protein
MALDRFPTLVDPGDLAIARISGTLLVRVSVDLLVLVGLGMLLAASLAVAFATTAAADRLVTGANAARRLLAAVGSVLGAGMNALLSIAVLTALPRLRMPLRRILAPALFVAAGLEVLKTLDGSYGTRPTAAGGIPRPYRTLAVPGTTLANALGGTSGTSTGYRPSDAKSLMWTPWVVHVVALSASTALVRLTRECGPGVRSAPRPGSGWRPRR